MKTQQYYKAFLAVATLPFFAGACTDAWDDHYGDGSSATTNAPTLWEHVVADADLEPFSKVLKYVGYDAVLSSPQSFTLWAPVITDEQADSVIAVYEAQKKELDNNGNQRKDQDNAAITQFVKNHMAMSGYSVSELTDDSVRMWNGKYMTIDNNALNGIPYLDKNIVASNGVMHKLETKETFFPNLREFLALRESMDSVEHFYRMFDDYDIDEQASVMQDIVDGEIVYADSVMTLNNQLYSNLAYIQREDSSYLFLAPTKEVWEAEYDKYVTRFKYINDTRLTNRDSVSQLNARYAICRGRYFNLNIQRSKGDSLTNTFYNNSQYYWGLNVFQDPYGADGILSGLTPIKCSNGLLYEDATGRIPDTLTFCYKRYLRPWYMRNYKSRLIKPKDSENYSPQVAMTVRSIVNEAEYNDEIIKFPELRENQYVELEPASYKNTTNINTNFYLYLHNTLSGMYYNVYVVMVPEYARANYDAEKILPVPFKVYFSERNEDPSSSTSTDNEDPDAGSFSRESQLKVPEGETHGSGSSFEATGQGVEVICIDKAHQFKFASANAFVSMDPTQRYRFYSTASSTQIKNKLKSNIMRINRLIYIPFETEQEALDFNIEVSDLSNLKEYRE